jgi:hypothetical protein
LKYGVAAAQVAAAAAVCKVVELVMVDMQLKLVL